MIPRVLLRVDYFGGNGREGRFALTSKI
jgi:hypothetical protein